VQPQTQFSAEGTIKKSVITCISELSMVSYVISNWPRLETYKPSDISPGKCGIFKRWLMNY